MPDAQRITKPTQFGCYAKNITRFRNGATIEPFTTVNDCQTHLTRFRIPVGQHLPEEQGEKWMCNREPWTINVEEGYGTINYWSNNCCGTHRLSPGEYHYIPADSLFAFKQEGDFPLIFTVIIHGVPWDTQRFSLHRVD